MTDAATPSLSIVIPTLNAAAMLPSCLEALQSWPDGREIFIVDGGSDDETVTVAYTYKATILPAERGRGVQLQRGGLSATKDWLLFVHADTVMAKGWETEARAFMSDIRNRQHIAAFRFSLDDESLQAQRIERMVAWRCQRLGLPYGDQGLLIHRDLYEAVGGYRALPLMEDVDLIRRVGRRNVHMFETSAMTSAARFQRDGWWARPSRNLFCLFLYLCGLPPHWIAKLYG